KGTVNLNMMAARKRPPPRPTRSLHRRGRTGRDTNVTAPPEGANQSSEQEMLNIQTSTTEGTCRRVRRRYAALMAAAAIVGLAAAANAAGLGGMQSADLGSATSIVESCDSDGVD